MRAAFLGTPAASVPSLAALGGIADIVLVVTQPDAAKGRSSKPVPPALKVAATQWGLPVAQPQSHRELTGALSGADLDIAVVVAYGRILRPAALESTRLGFVNVHFSLLPRWRGAAPVERAILAGDARTGVTLMLLDEGMDTGPLLGAVETEITDDETGGSLTGRLAYDGARLLSHVLPEYARGRVHPAPQMEGGATHAARLETLEAQIISDTSAAMALRMIRAFNPRPGAWCIIDGVRTKVWSAEAAVAPVSEGGIDIVDGAPVLGLAGGALTLTRLQPAGKRSLSGLEWANGRHGASARLTAP